MAQVKTVGTLRKRHDEAEDGTPVPGSEFFVVELSYPHGLDEIVMKAADGETATVVLDFDGAVY